jgi:hypothetical protein
MAGGNHAEERVMVNTASNSAIRRVFGVRREQLADPPDAGPVQLFAFGFISIIRRVRRAWFGERHGSKPLHMDCNIRPGMDDDHQRRK